MIRGLVKKVSTKSKWFSPSLRMVVGIPSGSTEVEIRAVRDSSEHAGGRDVYMIYEPMADVYKRQDSAYISHSTRWWEYR